MVSFKVDHRPDGLLNFRVSNGDTVITGELSPEVVTQIVSELLEQSGLAAKASGHALDKASQYYAVTPTAIALSSEGPTPGSGFLSALFGQASVAFPVLEPAKLGNALLALSAPSDIKN